MGPLKRLFFLSLSICSISGSGSAQAQTAADSVRIYYRQGHCAVDPLFGGNRSELEHFLESVRRACRSGEIDRVVIRSYASPDGLNRFNERLSQLRADSLAGYVSRHAAVPSSRIEKHAEGIAWSMLRELSASCDELPCKEGVLRILDRTPLWIYDAGGRIVDGRKKQLMDLAGGVPYNYMLEHLFPILRNSATVWLYTEDRDAAAAPSAGAAPAVQTAERSDSEPAPQSAAELRESANTAAELRESADIIAETRKPADTAAETAAPAAGQNVAHATAAAVAARSSASEEEPLHRLALKTNLLYDAVLMPSLEVEYHLTDRWSVAVEGDVAWWRNTPAHKYYQIATISPEARYWFKTRRRWHGHYAGIFAGGSWYDLENGGPGYRGDIWMAGVSYGYMFPVSRSLSFEAGIGVGFLHTEYEEYNPYEGHNVYRQTSRTDYFGPVKLKFAFVWRLWDENKEKGGAR